nr:hypothetical protein [Tanacetum cinerariifolium]
MLHVLRVEMVINSPWMLSKNWLVKKQMAFGKDISNPFMADNLPKIVWFSTHHITYMKSWLVQKKMALGKDTSNPSIVDSLLKTIWFSIHHHLTIEVLAIPGQTITGVHTPKSDEDRLKLMELMVFLLNKGVYDEFGLNAARLSNLLLSGKCDVTRVGKGFSRVETPLFESMLAVRDVADEAEAQVPAQGDDVQEPATEEVATDVVSPTPTSPSPSSPNDKAAQQLEIVKLKARVKKLEKINKVKSSKLRRLKKVGTSQRVESSDDVENVFNQGRIIVDMDQDEGIELVADQEKDTEVVAASIPIPAAKPKTLNITAAPAVSTRRRKGVVIRDPEEELQSDTPAETPKVKYKGKGILIEAPKPIKKKDQIEMDAEYARKLQEEINKEHEETYKNIDWNAALDHGKKYDEILPIFQAKFDANMKFLFKSREEMEKEDEEIIKSINETPAQNATKRRKLSEEAQEADDLRKRLEIVQDEDAMYPLSRFTLEQLVNVARLQVEEESEISLELLSYKHLDWITVRSDDDKLYKFKEGDFKRLRIQDIEDMLLLLVQGKLINLTLEERFAFNVSLRMFTRSIMIQRRVEDLQLGVESYQKNLNLTKLDSYRSDLKRKEAYTTYSNPRGFIYQNKDKKNRLMRINKLHKFSDETLTDVHTAIDDRLKGIRMQYLPQSI